MSKLDKVPLEDGVEENSAEQAEEKPFDAEEFLTTDQRRESAIREKEHDLTGVSAELVAKCNLHLEEDKDNCTILISGKINGHDVALTAYYDKATSFYIAYEGSVDGAKLEKQEAGKLYTKYKEIAWMQSGFYREYVEKGIDEESSKKTVDELLNL